MASRRVFLRQLTIFTGGLLAACGQAGIPATPTAGVDLTQTDPSAEYSAQEGSTQAGRYQILATGLNFPEGPAFDPQGNLWCTELLGGNLVKWVDDGLIRYPVGGEPGGRGNSLAFDHQGRAWVTDSGRNAILRFDPASEQWETILFEVDGEPLQGPNDLAFDAQGNLLFSCPNYASQEATGYVVCLSPDGSAKKIITGMNRPNGLDFLEGGKFLVVADTYHKVLIKGEWDAAAAVWKDPQPWAEVGGSEGPDGMAPGANGLLYQAIYGDGVIRVVSPEGKVQQEIQVPGANPTNVAIDPSGKLGIVVTETEKGQLISFPSVSPGVAIFDGGDAWQ